MEGILDVRKSKQRQIKIGNYRSFLVVESGFILQEQVFYGKLYLDIVENVVFI